MLKKKLQNYCNVCTCYSIRHYSNSELADQYNEGHEISDFKVAILNRNDEIVNMQKQLKDEWIICLQM